MLTNFVLENRIDIQKFTTVVVTRNKSSNFARTFLTDKEFSYILQYFGYWYPYTVTGKPNCATTTIRRPSTVPVIVHINNRKGCDTPTSGDYMGLVDGKV